MFVKKQANKDRKGLSGCSPVSAHRVNDTRILVKFPVQV